MTADKQVIFDRIVHWQSNLYDFCKEVLRVPHITSQQKEFLDALSLMIDAKRKMLFSRTNPKIVLTDKEKEIAGKFGISIRSGKGCGKDAVISMAILAYIDLFENARLPCIGPTGDHLRTVLWAEIAKWYKAKDDEGKNRFMEPFRSLLEITSKNVRFMGNDKAGEDWGAFRRMVPKNATSSELVGVLSGLHGENMLLIFDEAASIEDEVFMPLEDTMTDDNNIAVLIWNPTKTNGYAYNTHFGEFADQWVQIHWNAEDSERVTPEQIARLKRKYGETSDRYMVNVRGELPKGGDDSLIPWEWVSNAITREIEPDPDQHVVLGVDVARSGKDSTICCVRQGPKVHAFIQIDAVDGISVAMEVLRIRNKWDAEAIFIDSIGVGASPYDQLLLYWPKTYGVEVYRSADDDKFRRKRDELWWRCRERFEKGTISIPNDPELSDQLSVKYDTARVIGKIVIEGKDDMRKRLGGESPDKADSLVMTFEEEDFIFHRGYHRSADYEDEEDDKEDRLMPDTDAFMAV